MLPGNCCGGGQVMHGELDDVTVSQALDYVLDAFPGFWVYENCVKKEGERSDTSTFIDDSLLLDEILRPFRCRFILLCRIVMLLQGRSPYPL